ncbi:unnamed protein product [Tenebrio molitor]|nr:unnamed protein product [Tenebrio molitor]
MYGFLTEEIVRGFHLVFLSERPPAGLSSDVVRISTVSHSEIADAAWRSIVCGPYAINIFTSCRGWRDRVLRLHRCCTQQQ